MQRQMRGGQVLQGQPFAPVVEHLLMAGTHLPHVPAQAAAAGVQGAG
jgi:hypothetical protein